MRKAWLSALLATSLTSFGQEPLAAQGAPVVVSADLDFKTRYLFAGIPFAADEVGQAKVTVGRRGLTFNAFTVYDVDASDITEADIWGDYYAQVSPRLGAFVGAALYNFKIAGVWEATPEVYGGLTLATPLTPTLYFARDFDLGDGSHVQLVATGFPSVREERRSQPRATSTTTMTTTCPDRPSPTRTYPSPWGFRSAT